MASLTSMMDLCRLKQVGYVPIPCHFILRNLDMAKWRP